MLKKQMKSNLTYFGSFRMETKLLIGSHFQDIALSEYQHMSKIMYRMGMNF
jgi:hypothetical protein